MEELLETFDRHGKPLGLAPRSHVHREGLWHRAANVLLFHPDGRLWIQRRAAMKDVWPGAWDLSVAEHLAPGESYGEAAARGLSEELAVADIGLEPLGGVVRSRLKMPKACIRDYEYQQSFRAVHDGSLEPNTAEVDEVRLLPLKALHAAFVERPDDFTPWFRQRMKELRRLLQSA